MPMSRRTLTQRLARCARRTALATVGLAAAATALLA